MTEELEARRTVLAMIDGARRIMVQRRSAGNYATARSPQASFRYQTGVDAGQRSSASYASLEGNDAAPLAVLLPYRPRDRDKAGRALCVERGEENHDGADAESQSTRAIREVQRIRRPRKPNAAATSTPTRDGIEPTRARSWRRRARFRRVLTPRRGVCF